MPDLRLSWSSAALAIPPALPAFALGAVSAGAAAASAELEEGFSGGFLGLRVAIFQGFDQGLGGFGAAETSQGGHGVRSHECLCLG